MMDPLFRLPSSVERDPAVDVWMDDRPGVLGAIAHHWFEVMRECGEDVRELLHDGHPTACVADAAFAYVNAFAAHVNVGFFRGAELADPAGLLEGTGKLMRHVKIKPGTDVDAEALTVLIDLAYSDMRGRLDSVEVGTDPMDESMLLYRKGRTAMEAGRLGEAIEHFRRSSTLAPHFKTLELLGECLVRDGRPADAIEPLRAAAGRNLQVRAPSLLAEALLAVGDLEAARSAAESVLARSATNRRALGVLRRLGSGSPEETGGSEHEAG